MIRVHNSELANEYGNLLMRVLKLSQANFGESVPPSEAVDFKLGIFEEVNAAMDHREHHKAIAAIWTGVRKLNAYINTEEPWKKKGDKPALHKILYTALLNLNYLTVLLTPFIPESADNALNMLGGNGDAASVLKFDLLEFRPKDVTALFPKIETAPASGEV